MKQHFFALKENPYSYDMLIYHNDYNYSTYLIIFPITFMYLYNIEVSYAIFYIIYLNEQVCVNAPRKKNHLRLYM